MAIQIQESTAATVAPSAPGKLKVALITPGVGSSGYYSAEVLEAAARDRVWPAGTHIYFDHPTESEMYDRPERSVRDLAARLSEDAYWDGEQLVAEADVIGAYRDLVTDPVFVSSVGMSIRATAESRNGEVGGKKTTIITSLIEGISVDLVTHAGRGGKVLAVLESARETERERLVSRAVAHGVQEATANDTREALQQALRDTYGGEQTWVWVRDFDESTVWFELETPDGMGTYAQGYTLADTGAVSLEGDRAEVRARTEYVPVAADEAAAAVSAAVEQLVAAGVSREDAATAAAEALRLVTNVPAEEAGRSTTDPQEDPMSQTEEAAAGVVPEEPNPTSSTEGNPPADPAAIAEVAADPSPEEAAVTDIPGAGASAPNTPRQVLEGRITALTDQMAQMVARERARDIIAEELAEAWVVPSAVARLSSELIADLPIVDRQLDEATLRNRCVEARDRAELEAAETLNAVGVGTPRGLGALTRPAAAADEAGYSTDIAESLQSAFGLSESAAQTAVKGR